jgi:hypothetical protein
LGRRNKVTQDMSKIEKELMTLTGLKHKSGESLQDWLARLYDASEKKAAKDDVWEALSTPGQKWINAAAASIEKNADFPNFPDAKPDEDEDDEKPAKKKPAAKAKPAEEEDDDDAGDADEDVSDDDAEEDPDEEEKPRAKKKAPAKKEQPVAAKKKVAAKSKPEKPAKKAGAGGEGIKVRIKKMLLKRPKLSTEDLIEALTKNGEKLSKVTIAAVRSEFRHTIKVLNNEGVTEIDLG